MSESIEHSLEAINAVIAAVAFYLGVRALAAVTLAFQRRAVLFFLAALAFFASSELLAIAHLVKLLADVELLRELAETGFVACLVVALYMLRQSQHHEVTALRRWADTDDLTALHNHAHFRRAAQRRFKQAQDHNLPLTLILLDIDDFKAYNDSFGHEAGNFVLSFIAQILRDSVRADDIVARYGGEEFVVMTSDKLEYASKIAERIRITVETQCTPSYNPRLYRHVTVSLGVTHLVHETGSMEDLIEAADKQMYRAKLEGKNCVRIEDAA